VFQIRGLTTGKARLATVDSLTKSEAIGGQAIELSESVQDCTPGRRSWTWTRSGTRSHCEQTDANCSLFRQADRCWQNHGMLVLRWTRTS